MCVCMYFKIMPRWILWQWWFFFIPFGVTKRQSSSNKGRTIYFTILRLFGHLRIESSFYVCIGCYRFCCHCCCCTCDAHRSQIGFPISNFFYDLHFSYYMYTLFSISFDWQTFHLIYLPSPPLFASNHQIGPISAAANNGSSISYIGHIAFWLAFKANCP